jgi:predicted dienelactone hydrolase
VTEYEAEILRCRIRRRDYADKRIRAGFLICPAQGDLMSTTSLEEITAPVSIWWAGDDDQTPAETNALRYASLIPGASEHCAARSGPGRQLLGSLRRSAAGNRSPRRLPGSSLVEQHRAGRRYAFDVFVQRTAVSRTHDLGN